MAGTPEEPLRRAAAATVEGRLGTLVDLSHRIHAHPETCFEEERASAWTAELIEEGGYAVERGVCDLPTAFTASAGDGPLVIAICAEYDALPGIGHACGHNIIAAAAAGAAIALAPLADELGITVRVLGTPAEEGGGGKILMLERGAFDGVHTAMMVHPSPFDAEHMHCRALRQMDVEFTGHAAHASATPELGRNAADAQVLSQVAIGLLRQQLPTHDQVHGIVTFGGDAPNVIPARTVARWIVRSSDLAHLAAVEERVRACFQAGALATGCGVSITPTGPAYSEFRPDPGLVAAYRRSAEDLGRTMVDGIAGMLSASTDMANVSLALPSIHPLIGIGSFPAVNHQAEFAAACITGLADRAVRDGAIAMAWTAIAAALDPPLRERLTAGPGTP